MKRFFLSIAVFMAAATIAFSQMSFEAQIDPNWEPEVVNVDKSALTYQVLFIGNYHEVQTLGTDGMPNGSTPAKQWHDFIGMTPDNDSDDLAWVIVNHEMIQANDKIGDGGGMTSFKIRRDPVTDTLIIVEQTLADGRSGKFFNVDFVNTVGETGMNCGGIVSEYDGRLWTAEEWWQGSNEAIYAGGDGFRDTTDYVVSSDIEGDFDGYVLKRYENLNWMVEVDAVNAKAVRKQYNWGRQPFEGGCVLPDNQTVYVGSDATPGYFTKFVADVPGDFTKGKTYVYKQDEGAFTGSWVEIENTKMEDMLNFTQIAMSRGATMFNRVEWVSYNRTNGKIYFTCTGRDNPGNRLKSGAAAGATVAQHIKDRAAEQGVDPLGPDYVDYYGRVMEFDPSNNSARVFLEGGPDLTDDVTSENYPDKHLTNPDGLSFLYVNNKTYMIIQEDLNGSSMGRVPKDFDNNRTCEVYLHDWENEPSIDNLIRIAVVPFGAEVTGARATPDGKSLLINSQHPSADNPFPYNNSLTFALTGFDKLPSSIEDEPAFDNDGGFQVWPNPVTRELYFNTTTDVALYDSKGLRVKVYRNVDNINIAGLTPGAYFVRTLDGKGKKIIVQ